MNEKGLETFIERLSVQFPEVSFAKLSRIAVRVARWQQEEMLKDTLCVHVIGNGNFHKPLYCYKGEYDGEVDGKHVDLVLIKRYESKCDDKE